MQQATANLTHIKMTKKAVLLMLFSAAVFLAMTAYGLAQLLSGGSDLAMLVLTQGIVGLVLSGFPVILHKLFKLCISFGVQLTVTAFMFCAMVFGEALGFYYSLSWWDSVLHLLSGVGIAFAAYCLLNLAVKDSDLNCKFAFCLLGAIAASLAVGLVWEVVEFSIDSIFGTNMQKVVPASFFNGGQTNAELAGAQEEIGEFFASPNGYRYALMDTMKDLVLCLCGTLIFTVAAALTRKSKIYSTAIVKDKRVGRRQSVFADVAADEETDECAEIK